jgi:peptidoglycan/xylan/chitin deacetylase (PgdA/CDA1 family)
MLRTLALLVLGTVSAAVAQNKTVYLTFDDGPQSGTADVLDVLKEQGAHAAFFLTGSNAAGENGLAEQAALVKRELAEGHELGNHCFIHKPMTKADYRATYGDLSSESARKAFDANLGRNLDHFRARLEQPDFKFAFARLPGDGFSFPALVKEVEAQGMRHFAWNFEFATGPVGFTWLKALDWQGVKGARAEEAGLPPDGAVILFHDRHWAGENKAKLAAIVKLLKEKGYTFGKLADIKPKVPKAAAAPAAVTPAAQ